MLVSFLWSVLAGIAGLAFQGGTDSSGTQEKAWLPSCTVQCGASTGTGTEGGLHFWHFKQSESAQSEERAQHDLEEISSGFLQLQMGPEHLI